MIIYDTKPVIPNDQNFVLSPEMERKMKVLEYFGFKPNDETVKETVMNIYPNRLSYT